MSFWNQITRLVKDPPPAHVFEVSEAGLAYSFAHGDRAGFQPFPEGTIRVSPIEENLLRPDTLSSMLERIAPAAASRKRRSAALILPDYAARVSVLDFDSFPSSEEEQAQLVRFRVKKTVPFDMESAALSYFAQPASGSKKIEVVAVTVALEILARYEAVFRAANFHTGLVTTSSFAALNLHRGEAVEVVAKLSGNVLTVAVTAQGRLKLFRCLALECPGLEYPGEEEIRSVLYPTFAYVEDELGQRVSKIVTCGFEQAPVGLGVPVEPLESSLGPLSPHNAGLLGYLEGVAA